MGDFFFCHSSAQAYVSGGAATDGQTHVDPMDERALQMMGSHKLGPMQQLLGVVLAWDSMQPDICTVKLGWRTTCAGGAVAKAELGLHRPCGLHRYDVSC